MTRRVLLTGAGGQLGQALQGWAPADVTLLALDSRALDISAAKQVERQVAEFQPQLIINAAAYTQVDRAESEPEKAFAVNAEGPRLLARAADAGTRFIHVSTDFVFDGQGSEPYAPSATPAPLGVYGRSKLAGEQAVLAAKPSGSLVLRTAWVYSPGGHNFLLTMLRLMATRDSLSVVDDQRGTPTSAASLARAIWELSERSPAEGVLHWTDAGETTWHGFALEIQRRALAHGLLKRAVPIQPIATTDYPTPARRPTYSVLDKSCTETLLGRGARPWQEELDAVLAQLVDAGYQPA